MSRTFRYTPAMVALVLPLLVLIGCSGKEGGDDTGGGGAVDSETGGDSGGDTGPVHYTGFSGTMTYYEGVNGVAICDADIQLEGTEYTGDCGDCDFAFTITPSITRDGSTTDCVYNPLLTFIEDPAGGFYDLFLVHIPIYEAGGGYNYYNLLQTGYSYYSAFYGADYPGPYYATIGYGGGYFGRTTFRDDVLNLDFYYYVPPTEQYVGSYYNACGDVGTSTETTDHGGEALTSRLPCDGLSADMWTFDVAEGAALAVSVDTLSDETTFSPMLIVNGPDGCTEVVTEDNFLCSYPPPGYLCPSWYVERAGGGSYQAMVLNAGDCEGTTGEYALHVDGATNLTLVSDDYTAWRITSDSYLLRAVMDATLTPAP